MNSLSLDMLKCRWMGQSLGKCINYELISGTRDIEGPSPSQDWLGDVGVWPRSHCGGGLSGSEKAAPFPGGDKSFPQWALRKQGLPLSNTGGRTVAAIPVDPPALRPSLPAQSHLSIHKAILPISPAHSRLQDLSLYPFIRRKPWPPLYFHMARPGQGQMDPKQFPTSRSCLAPEVWSMGYSWASLNPHLHLPAFLCQTMQKEAPPASRELGCGRVEPCLLSHPPMVWEEGLSLRES